MSVLPSEFSSKANLEDVDQPEEIGVDIHLEVALVLPADTSLPEAHVEQPSRSSSQTGVILPSGGGSAESVNNLALDQGPRDSHSCTETQGMADTSLHNIGAASIETSCQTY